MNQEDIIKYETRNPVSRFLLNGFFDAIGEMLKNIDVKSICDAGCGSGYVTSYLRKLKPDADIIAFDLDDEKLALANVDGVTFERRSIYDTNFADNSFDLVVSSEVLEHLETPEIAISELYRIARRYVLLSVPNEPIWRIMNMARGKYLRDFGNTPGHINHWGAVGRPYKRSFGGESLVASCEKCGLRLIAMRKPLPWQMLLCETTGTHYV